MAPSLSRPSIQTPVGEKQLEITVRNTFVHVAVPDLADADADQEQQPDVRRAFTTPVAWLSEESGEEEDEDTEDDEEGQEGALKDEILDCSPQPCLLRIATHDPFEASMVRKQSSLRSIRRMATHDRFESPVNSAQPHLIQMDMHNPLELGATRRRPSFRSLRTYDVFESPAGPVSAAGQFGDTAEGATASFPSSGEQLHFASAGWAPSVSQMTTESAMMQPLSGREVADSSSAAEAKLAGAARGRSRVQKTPSSLTTIMLRNLPNNYTRAMLLDLIEWAGFAGKYDFLYLPIDFRTHAALGYAFVNLSSPEDAEALRKFFDGFSRWALPSSKVCSAAWSHPHQGYEAHVQRYRNSPLMHEAVPDAYRPVLFADGVRIPFPPPTKRIKPPRQGTERMLV